MGKRLILLTTDRSFVLPTLIACQQILAQSGMSQIADVMVVTTDLTVPELEVLSETGANLGVSIRQHALDRELLSTLHFNKTHVPDSTLMRLYTPGVIDAEYEHVVYIDGDVLIVGDIRPLISYNVPREKLLAAPDRFMLGGLNFGWRAAGWQEDLSYLRSLGINDPSDYFNAGVLAANRNTWSSVCEEALLFFKKNSQLCKFHDQSALNAVCKGKTISLSPAYNFNSSFREVGAQDFIDPRIIHFTGGNKPWLPGAEATYAMSYRSLSSAFQHRFPACWEIFAIAPNGVAPGWQPPERQSIYSKMYERYARFTKRRSFERYFERTGVHSSTVTPTTPECGH
jgi:lipopolysaccharide biosynthesis glycosyltransferase